MAGARMVFSGEPLSSQFRRRFGDEIPSYLARGISGGARDAARDFLALGRANIASSGNFGIRWTHGLYADVEPKFGALVNARIDIGHRLWFAFIHEYGGIVRGRPLLWIPLSFAGDAKGVWARDFPGGLFRVDRAVGKPLLLSIRDKQPKYFGTPQVYIPQRWNLRGIALQVMNRFDQYYNKHLASAVRR